MTMSESHSSYYLPDPSHWPLLGSIALFTTFVGTAILLNGSHFGTLLLGFIDIRLIEAGLINASRV